MHSRLAAKHLPTKLACPSVSRLWDRRRITFCTHQVARLAGILPLRRGSTRTPSSSSCLRAGVLQSLYPWRAMCVVDHPAASDDCVTEVANIFVVLRGDCVISNFPFLQLLHLRDVYGKFRRRRRFLPSQARLNNDVAAPLPNVSTSEIDTDIPNAASPLIITGRTCQP